MLLMFDVCMSKLQVSDVVVLGRYIPYQRQDVTNLSNP